MKRRSLVLKTPAKEIGECEFLMGYHPGKKYVKRIEIEWLNKGALTFRNFDSYGKYKTSTLPAEHGIPYMKTMFHAWIKIAQDRGENGDITEIFFGGTTITVKLALAFIRFFERPEKHHLGFDVEVLLKTQDLRVDEDTPAWYRGTPWFIVDDMSKRFEKEQATPYLYTGKEPARGQKIEICAYLPNGSWGRLSGQVTEVLPAPSKMQASKFCAPQHCWDIKSRHDVCCDWGAVHGQQVEATVSLNFDFLYKQDLVEFFRGENAGYQVVLWCHHCKMNMWEVMSIESSPTKGTFCNI